VTNARDGLLHCDAKRLVAKIEVRFESCGFIGCVVSSILQNPLWEGTSEEKVLPTVRALNHVSSTTRITSNGTIQRDNMELKKNGPLLHNRQSKPRFNMAGNQMQGKPARGAQTLFVKNSTAP
jgi:hypothetical protein